MLNTEYGGGGGVAAAWCPSNILYNILTIESSIVILYEQMIYNLNTMLSHLDRSGDRVTVIFLSDVLLHRPMPSLEGPACT